MRLLVVGCLAICVRRWNFIRLVSTCHVSHSTLGPPKRVFMDFNDPVIEADPTHNEAKMKLAELYEIMDEPRKALDLVYQGTVPTFLRYICSSLTD